MDPNYRNVLECLSFVKMSHVKNFRWSLSFLASCIVWMLWRTGWVVPERPHSCTLRYFILVLVEASLLNSFSYQMVTLILTRQSHVCLHQGWSFWRRTRGDGSPYFRHSSWMWLLQVVELLLHILSKYWHIP